MNAQAILEKIGEDARLAAQGVVTEAQKKADQIQEASRAKMESQRETMIAQADKESVELEARMLRMAELEDRKELLFKKQALMDEAFAMAKQQLLAMPKGELRAFFLKQVAAAAQGEEQLAIGVEKADWFDSSFAEEANKALAAQGKKAGLVASGEKRPGCTGVVLLSQGAEVLCTLETVLDSLRGDMEAQIAKTLFH